MTQLDDMDFIAVRIQCERRDPNSPLQCWAGLCNSPSRWFDKKSRVTSSTFTCRYSVFFWHLLLLEQMTKEVPGIRPAVISAEPGTRMDEDYNGEITPVNNLDCKAEEKTFHIVLVNATCFSTFS